MTLQTYRLACVRGGRQLFHNIHLDIHNGDALRIVGSNGSGKTSLLRMVCGLSLPTEGAVHWQGKKIQDQREEFGRQVIYLGHAPGVKDDLTAWENVMIAATLSGQSISREQASCALARLGLGGEIDLPARVLSQGQRKRVALTRLWFGETSLLWILDEPFAALDREAVADLCHTLNVHLARGGMVIYTTHQEAHLTARRHLSLDLNQLDSSC